MQLSSWSHEHTGNKKSATADGACGVVSSRCQTSSPPGSALPPMFCLGKLGEPAGLMRSFFLVIRLGAWFA